MAKIQKRALLPPEAKFSMIEGEEFIKLRDAARLAGIPPVVLSMGQRLLADVGGAGAAFPLATDDLKANADGIIKQFKTGLRRYAKATSRTPLKPEGVSIRAALGVLVCVEGRQLADGTGLALAETSCGQSQPDSREDRADVARPRT